jgi:hypothetical protein
VSPTGVPSTLLSPVATVTPAVPCKSKFPQPLPKATQFDALRGPTGALLIGDAETIAEKILYVSEVLVGLSRITFQMGVSALPHEKMLRSIDLLGTRVAPILRKELTTVSSHQHQKKVPLRLRSGTDDDLVYINFSRLLDGERNRTSDRRRWNRHLFHPLGNLGFHPGICHGVREVRVDKSR